MLRKIKILITEDKKINQEILMGILEDSGLDIDIACNGEEAVKRCRENSYALILMDIEMPIMDGYEATKRIRANNIEIPIIALTANDSLEDRCKTKAIGMNEHLSKPIEPNLLYKTFSKYIHVA
jgi:CheY-like chemotaxis protein